MRQFAAHVDQVKGSIVQEAAPVSVACSIELRVFHNGQRAGVCAGRREVGSGIWTRKQAGVRPGSMFVRVGAT
jgi:hypothetical protein